MPSFSPSSISKLATCDVRLREIAELAVQDFDFSVVCGHRDKEEQDKAVRFGFSKAPFPTSKHNSYPSKAMDLVPYPEGYKVPERMKDLAKHILVVAEAQGTKIRWGGDWNMNGRSDDEKFIDMPHFELVEEKEHEAPVTRASK